MLSSTRTAFRHRSESSDEGVTVLEEGVTVTDVVSSYAILIWGAKSQASEEIPADNKEDVERREISGFGLFPLDEADYLPWLQNRLPVSKCFIGERERESYSIDCFPLTRTLATLSSAQSGQESVLLISVWISLSVLWPYAPFCTVIPSLS